MLSPKKPYPSEKSILHPRNKHRARYDFNQLTVTTPELKPFVMVNKYGDESIDFFDPKAVRLLNKALLKHFYQIDFWEIPTGYLCPSIPGRVDYIHYLADLLYTCYDDKMPQGENIKCLDIGTGASSIYPLLGHQEYGWSFVGSDIDPAALESAKQILQRNPLLRQTVELRLQKNSKSFFQGIIHQDEVFDLTLCNPPFHASIEDARAATQRKSNNLRPNKTNPPILNFGGRANELFVKGGELKFILDMVQESKLFSSSCFWFSTLVSKASSIKPILASLKKMEAVDMITIPMGQGNKISRIIAWTFLHKKQQLEWINTRWR